MAHANFWPLLCRWPIWLISSQAVGCRTPQQLPKQSIALSTLPDRPFSSFNDRESGLREERVARLGTSLSREPVRSARLWNLIVDFANSTPTVDVVKAAEIFLPDDSVGEKTCQTCPECRSGDLSRRPVESSESFDSRCPSTKYTITATKSEAAAATCQRHFFAPILHRTECTCSRPIGQLTISSRCHRNQATSSAELNQLASVNVVPCVDWSCRPQSMRRHKKRHATKKKENVRHFGNNKTFDCYRDRSGTADQAAGGPADEFS